MLWASSNDLFKPGFKVWRYCKTFSASLVSSNNLFWHLAGTGLAFSQASCHAFPGVAILALSCPCRRFDVVIESQEAKEKVPKTKLPLAYLFHPQSSPVASANGWNQPRWHQDLQPWRTPCLSIKMQTAFSPSSGSLHHPGLQEQTVYLTNTVPQIRN